MHLVVPDILVAARGLSLPVCSVGLALSLILWLFGGRTHRFWLVLLVTVSSGVYGLSVGEAHGVQPLVAGLLFAVAAGALALSLVRVMAFAAGGLMACLVAERLAPGWEEPFIFFFVGGFVGLFFLRLWMMALTSLAGTLLGAYSLLWLLDGLGKLDSVEYATRKPVLIDWACVGTALLGLLIQLTLERARWRKSAQKPARDERSRDKGKERDKDKDRDKDAEDRAWTILSWWRSPPESRKGKKAA